MAEADALCTAAIRDALGLPSKRVRPLRAGDYSFNQIGPTGLYMLLSNIPAEERKAAATTPSAVAAATSPGTRLTT